MYQGRSFSSKILKYVLKSVESKGLQETGCLSTCAKQNFAKNQVKFDVNGAKSHQFVAKSASARRIPCRQFCCKTDAKAAKVDVGSLKAEEFAEYLTQNDIQRGFVIFNEETGKPEASSPALQDLADRLGAGEFEYDGHEAVFFARGSRSNCLLSAFLWKTNRGQGSGGVDFIPVKSMKDLLNEGHRMSKNLGIKCSLSGIWAGGGKGIIAAPKGNKHLDPFFRRQAYMDFGDFLTSLNGCFIAGLGVGTSMADMEDMYSNTRYVSNVSSNLGGTGLTALYTGLGVVKAMEAALHFLHMGPIAGKTVAIQGAGLVGEVIVDELLKKGVRNICVAESSKLRVDDVLDRFADKAEGRLTVKKVGFDDTSIFSQNCDIFSPCARGKVLNKNTIPLLNTKIICGASNCPVDSMEDYKVLADMNITYATDVVPNRMGMVSKLLEPYGRLENDPLIYRHFSEDWEYSIYQTVLRILRLAEEKNIPPEHAAYEIGEEHAKMDHPLYPNRAKSIVRGLAETGWHEGKDYWKDREYYLGEADLL